MDETTGQKILEKIKQGHITPKPRWEFLLKDYVVWLFCAVCILVGSLATSAMLFMLSHADWQYFSSDVGGLPWVMINLPYFWLTLVIVFLAIAYYNFKNTKQGYHYDALVIAIMSVIVSIIVGGAIYGFGGGERFEDFFYRHVSLYQRIMEHRGRLLLSPQQGRIPGVVVGVDNNLVLIRDFNGRIWQINTTTSEFSVGQRIMIIGRMLPDEQFEAQVLDPWFRIRHSRSMMGFGQQ